MRIRVMFAFLPLLAGCHQPPPANSPADMAVATSSASASAVVAVAAAYERDASSVEAMPAEVQAFIEARDECDHWRGEEPYDDDRAREITNAINNTCNGSDRKLAGLRQKYQDQPHIMQALADYEDKIENQSQ